MSNPTSRCSEIPTSENPIEGAPQFSLVMPAYNEALRIGEALEKYCSAWDEELSRRGITYEIIVVANGCTDDTSRVVGSLMSNPAVGGEIRLLRLGEGNKGLAVLAGFQVAHGTTVGFTDADGSVDPQVMLTIMRRAQETGLVAVGSKYHPDAHASRTQRKYRLIASRVWNLLVRFVLGLHVRDTQAGAKAMPIECARTILDHVLPCNFAFDVSLLFEAAHAGYEIVEIPLEWEHMNDSTFSVLREAPRMFKALLQIRLASYGRWHTSERIRQAIEASAPIHEHR